MWEWAVALKQCGAIFTEQTMEAFETYAKKKKKFIKKFEEDCEIKYNELIKKMEEDAAMAEQESARLAHTLYQDMEEQCVRDYDRGKIKPSKICPCGSGKKFGDCHFLKLDDIRTRIDEEERVRKEAEDKDAAEIVEFEQGLRDLYAGGLLSLDEPCPCEQGKKFKKCHYISLGLDVLDKEQQEKDKAKAKKKALAVKKAKLQARKEKLAAKKETMASAK
eukprot:SAG11_NODE_4796_length_1764_cov_1.126727_1_plen_220_part_00